MPPIPKHLALLRHAKSSWAEADIADHERPLNARGRRAAPLMGRALRQAGPPPDLVLCSSATRARQTLQLLDLAPGTEILVEDQLYGAAAETLFGRLRTVPTAVGFVLLIGHNPGIEQLARMLDGGGLASVEKFPTAGLAVLGLPIRTWSGLTAGVGEVDTFITPRDLASTETDRLTAT